MSFKPLHKQETASTEGRSCLIFYNLAGKDLQTAKNLAGMLGLRDIVITTSKNSKVCIQDLLDTKPLPEDGEGIKERAILFHQIPATKLSAFMDHLKKFRLSGILYATITETSIHWTLDELLANLVAERQSFKEGKPSYH
ncbi:hypothetical protein CS063_08270 [Sporanaerobium hydrogeniformans]|uniref:Uncharacterized protein n=1 Tax=Sporanaerobium hydrogeniformans TaxID=3072179 RepID=A0AC61DC02_9FIRM|nr:DUF3783 domain-containing protein [Sporanaerobium hydrogeniformans]PHV70755.1 hypothetical protein CS063_08270 [Sporanaerobium hydrogeniformans]